LWVGREEGEKEEEEEEEEGLVLCFWKGEQWQVG